MLQSEFCVLIETFIDCKFPRSKRISYMDLYKPVIDMQRFISKSL